MDLAQYTSMTEMIGAWKVTYQPTWTHSTCTGCKGKAIASLFRCADRTKNIEVSSVKLCRPCLDKAAKHEMDNRLQEHARANGAPVNMTGPDGEGTDMAHGLGARLKDLAERIPSVMAWNICALTDKDLGILGQHIHMVHVYLDLAAQAGGATSDGAFKE